MMIWTQSFQAMLEPTPVWKIRYTNLPDEFVIQLDSFQDTCQVSVKLVIDLWTQYIQYSSKTYQLYIESQKGVGLMNIACPSLCRIRNDGVTKAMEINAICGSFAQPPTSWDTRSNIANTYSGSYTAPAPADRFDRMAGHSRYYSYNGWLSSPRTQVTSG